MSLGIGLRLYALGMCLEVIVGGCLELGFLKVYYFKEESFSP